MKSLLLCLSLLLCAFAAQANTNVSGCTTITTGGTYDLTNTVSFASSADCFLISGVTTPVIFDCHDYLITDTQSSSGGHSFFRITSNSASVTVHNCAVDRPYASTPLANRVKFVNLDTTQGYFYSNWMSKVTLWAVGCGSGNSVEVYDNTGIDSNIYAEGCDGAYIATNNLSGFTLDAGGAIWFLRANSGDIEYNTIDANNAVDDNIVISGVRSGTIYISTYVGHNTLSNPQDMCFEYSGRWAYTYIDTNSCSGANVAAVGAVWDFSLDNSLIDGNTLTNSPGRDVISFDTDNSSTSFFTNNTIQNNATSQGKAGGASSMGSTGAPYQFTSYYGNSVYNNTFGASVTFQSASGVSDTGLNVCYFVYPSGAITCH